MQNDKMADNCRRFSILNSAFVLLHSHFSLCTYSGEVMADVGVVNFAREKHAVEMRDIPRPTIGPEDVLLEVAAVGVCGSDLHQWTCDHAWPVNYPVVLGHEFGGIIRELGTNVTGWREGDRAVS